jgi:hypothetical protein
MSLFFYLKRRLIKYLMEKTYICPSCTLQFKSYSGFFKHKKSKHPEGKQSQPKGHYCKFCNANYKSRQTKWSHEQKCKTLYKTPIDEKIKELTDEIATLKSRPQNIINNNTTNNTNNIQYIIKAPGTESINHLTFEKQKEIMQKGLNSLTYLIELTNFNKELPENHTYCITSLTGSHASVIDDKTNRVIKADKIDLFDKILISTLKNLENICVNKNFTSRERYEYREKLESLKKILFQNRKGMKRYYKEINLISYNNKEIIFETWASLKSLDKIIESESNPNKLLGFDDLAEDYDGDTMSDTDSDIIDDKILLKASKIKQIFDDFKNENQKAEESDESSDSDTDSDSDDGTTLKSHKYVPAIESDDEEIEQVEITIKNSKYILEGPNVYFIVNNKKAQLYGTFANGKVKKIQNKEIDV